MGETLLQGCGWSGELSGSGQRICLPRPAGRRDPSPIETVIVKRVLNWPFEPGL
jgi:hypothetical protein